jgi:predicted peptidase
MGTWCGRLVMVVLILGGAATAVRAGIPGAGGPGVYTQLMERSGAPAVTFTLSVPSGYSPDTPAPLVVALHYSGPVTPFFGGGMLRTLVEPALRSLNAVMVAPDCPAGRWDDPMSEAAVLDLIREIRQEYAIDPRRIILTGYSLGGMGTWYLAARHPDLFCAAIPMASRTDATTAERARSVPLYVIHSAADQLLPVEQMRALVESLRRQGVRVEYVELAGVDHYDVSAFIEPLRAAAAWLERRWRRAE